MQLASSLHFFCSEESILNVGRFVNLVLLDCDTHPPHVVCCDFIYSITDVELLIIVDSLPDLAPYISTSPRFSAS